MEKDVFLQIQNVLDNSHAVLPHTNSRGKDVIKEQIQALQVNWDILVTNITSTCAELQHVFSQSQTIEQISTKLNKWLGESETSMKNYEELLSTLPEKSTQLDKIKVVVYVRAGLNLYLVHHITSRNLLYIMVGFSAGHKIPSPFLPVLKPNYGGLKCWPREQFTHTMAVLTESRNI